MKIARTTTIEFDENKERTRILAVFKSKKNEPVRIWLLNILDCFITGEWNQAIGYLKEDSRPKDRDENPLEYLNVTVYNILTQFFQDTKQAGIFSIDGKVVQ